MTLIFDLLTSESLHVMPLEWSIPAQSLNWISLTFSELWWLQFPIDRQLKVLIFTFFGAIGGEILNLIFLIPKGTTLSRTTHYDILSVGVRQKVRPVAVAKEQKKDRNFHASDHPRRCSPRKVFMRGRVQKLVIYLKISRKSIEGSRSCGGHRKSPSPIDKAHGLCNSLYYRTSRDCSSNFVIL